MAVSFINRTDDQASAYNETVPVNLKDRDAFHLTIEEYLLALVSLLEELVWH